MTEKVYVVSHFKYNIATYSHFYNWLLCCRVVNCDFGKLLYKSCKTVANCREDLFLSASIY